MSYQLIFICYVGAIIMCFAGASARPRWRGPLIGLGVALTVPAVLFVAAYACIMIALSHGAHIG